MDNTGAYVTYQELLDRLYPTSYVSYRSSLTLSNKTGNVFEYAGSAFALQANDIICQGEYAQIITTIQTTPDRLTLVDATNIAEGTAYVYRTSKSIELFDMLRTQAMQVIDLYTGQWFNKRTFSNLRVEGVNTDMLHFSIPIIEITSLKINNSTDAMDAADYIVYNGRAIPDDRRNPKIKLIPTRLFYERMFNTIDGSFGFLEPNGATPDLIKFATARLVMTELTRDLEATESREIKREKTDLHEIEYETTSSGGSSGTGTSGPTGDEDLDRILKMYKSPFKIVGSSPFYDTLMSKALTNEYVKENIYA